MGQIYKITKAWFNVLKGETTEEHKRRAKICANCPKAKHKTYLDFINDELIEVNGVICSVCKCPLVAKIRSTDKCPENKW